VTKSRIDDRLSGKAVAAVCLFLLCQVFVSMTNAQEWRSAVSAGDYDRARAELDRALSAQPDDAELRYQLARVLGFAGRNEQALAEYDRLLAQSPANADYLLGRAQMLGRIGQTAEALRVTADALELAPDYLDLWQLRLQLAERTGDAQLIESVRAEAASRYPDADWWQRPSRPFEYSRWLTAGTERSSLSNGAPDWDRHFVRLDWRLSDAASYFGEIARSSRFGRSDLAVNVGGDWQALPVWRLGGVWASVPSADFEARRALSVSAGRSWQSSWGTQFQLRRRDYSATAVSSYSVSGDRYFSDYRVAYGLNYSRLHGAGSSLAHTATFGWYPSERRLLAVSVGAGEEIETVGLNQLLRTDVKSVTLSGRELLATRYTLNWWLGAHRQGDFYRRHYAGISVRFGI
jgi:YaiO family outer membrane protein